MPTAKFKDISHISADGLIWRQPTLEEADLVDQTITADYIKLLDGQMLQPNQPQKIADVRTEIVMGLNTAQTALRAAYTAGCTANPMCADTEVFRRMQELAKEVAGMMLAVQKLRGL